MQIFWSLTAIASLFAIVFILTQGENDPASLSSSQP
jgi:hypothetical protein